MLIDEKTVSFSGITFFDTSKIDNSDKYIISGRVAVKLLGYDIQKVNFQLECFSDGKGRICEVLYDSQLSAIFHDMNSGLSPGEPEEKYYKNISDYLNKTISPDRLSDIIDDYNAEHRA